MTIGPNPLGKRHMSPLTMGREENLGFTEKILRDAAAVAAMRERIEKMVPKKI